MRWLLILVVLIHLFAAQAIPQDRTSTDVQSTTGPIPPADLFQGFQLGPGDSQVVIANVPPYDWYNGCGPTAAGMVIGYWDGQGFDALVPGSAATQTAEVDAMISSSGNYSDYCLPIDSYPNLLPDKSEPPIGDEHADDSVADFMDTSQSFHSNYYGWSWFSDVDNSLEGYVSHISAFYDATAVNRAWGSLTWSNFKAEIDADRPLVFLVDTDGDGNTDHFVTAIGYSDDGGVNKYACYNTWDHNIHWYEFAQISYGQQWGIYGATFLTLEKKYLIYVPADYPTIQQALNNAVDGQQIVVSPNTYFENIDFLGKAVMVRSDQGADKTVIDGTQIGSVVIFQNNEGSDSVLDGFTVTNGSAFNGSGICCQNYTSPTLKNNIITNNSGGKFGGGISVNYSCAPAIENNHIEGNSAQVGSGICCSNSSGTISGNVITGNISTGSYGYGGAIYCFNYANPTIENNLLYENTAESGGAITLSQSDALIMNNTITDNTANKVGGGIYGFNASAPAVTNNILWNNSAPLGPEIYAPYATLQITYCDITGGWIGEGNIAQDPLFSDPGNDDYHLTWLSPCINRGTNNNAPSSDMDGDARPKVGTVDMGADEFIGTHALDADKFSISDTFGGSVQFSLYGSANNGNRIYIVLGSVSKTAPGTPLPGGQAVLPLNWDIFTTLTIALSNTSIFQNFMSQLSSQGQGQATLNFPPGTGAAGLTLYFAFALHAPWDFASNPVAIEIEP